MGACPPSASAAAAVELEAGVEGEECSAEMEDALLWCMRFSIQWISRLKSKQVKTPGPSVTSRSYGLRIGWMVTVSWGPVSPYTQR